MISVNDVARLAQTISYEMLCTVGRRVPRVYREGEPDDEKPAAVKITRALLGVSDKAGLAEFARALERRGVEMISTGGTQAALESGGVKVKAVEDFTGFPEMLDGRVKTLHPKIHGGILARRDDDDPSTRRCASIGIEPIDLVVVNFYPFEQTVAQRRREPRRRDRKYRYRRPDAGARGGEELRTTWRWSSIRPTMRRSPRNCESNGGALIAADAMAAGAQGVCARDRVRLRDLKLPRRDRERRSASRWARPSASRWSARRHCATARIRISGRAVRRFPRIAEQLHGRELSFNNVFDISSAINLMVDFADYSEAVVAILKHNTPCGVGVGATLRGRVGQGVRDRSRLALRRDHHRQPPVGPGIRARRRRTVHRGFDRTRLSRPGVLEFLRKKKNRRVMRFHPEARQARRTRPQAKSSAGCWCRRPDLSLEDPREAKS